MSLLSRALFAASRAVTAPAVAGLERSLADPEAAQERLLRRLLRDLARTAYGRSLGIRGDETRDEFQAKVPIARYEDLAPWIARQRRADSLRGEAGRALCAEPVRLYEKTSGSSGGAKLIPYTPGLQRAFQRMFLAWAGDLLRRGPGLRGGKAYFSVSPQFIERERTEAGVPVGLEDDSEYLSGAARSLLDRFAVPTADLRKLREPAEFKRALARRLAETRNLEVISVWNPSLLELVLDELPDPRDRAEPMRLWPGLKLISCWADASAAPAAARLAKRFPGVLIQPKGLLATEGPLTLPWLPAGGAVPLPEDALYELIEPGSGRVLALDELARGSTYAVAFSQLGGLVRYRIGDLVQVTGSYRSAPLLRFAGREDAVSDLVGEKLHERFVESVIESVLGRVGAAPARFEALVPEPGSRPARYLWVRSPLASSDPGDRARWEQALDRELQSSPHYRNARSLGQLGAPRIVEDARAGSVFLDACVESGMKAGDVKEPRLVRNSRVAELTLSRLGLRPEAGA